MRDAALRVKKNSGFNVCDVAGSYFPPRSIKLAERVQKNMNNSKL